MKPVRSTQLAVIQTDGHWSILVNGEPVGWFDRKADAVYLVQAIAGQTRCDGYPVEVLVQEPFGDLRSVGPGLRRSLS